MLESATGAAADYGNQQFMLAHGAPQDRRPVSGFARFLRSCSTDNEQLTGGG